MSHPDDIMDSSEGALLVYSAMLPHRADPIGPEITYTTELKLSRETLCTFRIYIREINPTLPTGKAGARWIRIVLSRLLSLSSRHISRQ